MRRPFLATPALFVCSLASLATCECAPPSTPSEHLDLDTVLGPGEVRCGPVTKDSELIGGPVAYGQVGRAYRCHNARIRFLLQDASRPVGNSVEGGNIIDIDRVRPDELAPGNDTFREMVSALGALEVRVTAIEVVNDGTDGRPGVIRVRGVPAPLSLAPQAAFLSQDLQGEITTDYELAPDDDVIKITTTLFNDGETEFGVLGADFLAIGGATPAIAPEFGFGSAPTFGRASFLVGARGTDVNVGYVCEGRDAVIPLVAAGITVPLCTDDLVIGAEGGFTRFLVVGDGSVDSVARRAWQLLGRETGEVAGAVAGALDTTPEGTLVSALSAPLSDPDSHVVSEARVRDGRYALALPPGDYTLVAHAPLLSGAQVARGVEVPVRVEAGATATIDLALGGRGHLAVETTFEDGVARPVKLTVVPVDDTPRAAAVLRELGVDGIVRYEGSVDGRFSIELPVGSYDVYVTRGFEYSRFAQRVEILAGGAAQVRATLARAIDTTGFVAGEFHQHSLGSIDASVPLPRKVLENAIEGIEVAVSTEHDNIADYRPFVAQLGLSPFLVAFAGNEVSYQAIGHFNVYPWTIDPADPLRDVGSRMWWGKTFPQMVDDVRAGAGPGAIVQLNHPRSGGTGVLASMQFDPTTGRRLSRDPPSLPTLPARVYEAWTPAFDAIEVNTNLGNVELYTADGLAELARRADEEESSIPVLADWFGLMGAGLPIAATGNSDTHGIGEGVGYPRTFVFMGDDDPTRVDEARLQTALRAQRTAIAQGCLLTLTVDGAPRMGAGDVIDAATAQRLRVRLQAPPHVGVGRLELYVNGRVQALVADADGGSVAIDAAGRNSLPLADTAAAPALGVDRLDHALLGLPSLTDVVVVAVSRGGSGLAPTGGTETICVSPPLYVDGDGDGLFSPWLSATETVTTAVP